MASYFEKDNVYYVHFSGYGTCISCGKPFKQTRMGVCIEGENPCINYLAGDRDLKTKAMVLWHKNFPQLRWVYLDKRMVKV